MSDFETYMKEAINEAKISLREGNHGFGTIIIKNDKVISKAHDLEETTSDSTSHAEINAIKSASKIIGKNLEDCILISTHEPCPMCSSAILWSGIKHIAYGYSINQSIKQGRRRLNITCNELFDRAGISIKIDKDILFDQCGILYSRDVRNEITRLRNYNMDKLKYYNEDSRIKRLKWFKDNYSKFKFLDDNQLDSAYNLLLSKFNIDNSKAKIIERSDNHIVFHSKNFCPTLEACKILGYDTRIICKYYNENSTDSLIKQIDKHLKFSRNYEKLRPYSEYCEEMISLENNIQY